MRIKWTKEFDVDIPSLDQQHQHLVGMVNEFHTMMRGEQSTVAVVKMVQVLAAHTQKHFMHEEALMQTTEYQRYAEHKREHERLLHVMQALKNECQSGSMRLTLNVLDALSDGLQKHIQQTDKTYTAWFQRHGIN